MVDTDAALSLPKLSRGLRRLPWDIIGVVALGGALGAVARYGMGVAWPTTAGAFPWTTFVINVLGCALIGTLMVLIGDVWVAHRLVRPFVGTGILGGFTTFSTYVVDVERLVTVDAARTGLVYLVATPTAALAAVWVGVMVTRVAVRSIGR